MKKRQTLLPNLLQESTGSLVLPERALPFEEGGCELGPPEGGELR